MVKVSESWTTETNGRKKKIGSGRKALFSEAEDKLYNWIIAQRKEGLAVTYMIIQNKMREILREPSIIVRYNSNLINNFKVLLRWLGSFLKRYKLSLR